MKKYTSILLSLVLVLGCAAMAFAVPADIPADTKAAVAKGGVQVTIFGDLRFRGSYWKNTMDFYGDALNRNYPNGVGVASPRGNGERAVYESRIRLGFDIAANANTTGRILLEASNGVNQDNNPWGGAPSAASAGVSNLNLGDSKSMSMYVLEAWLQHKGNGIFGVPAYIKVGHMPVKIGNGLFYSHTRMNDDAIFVGIEPVKGLNLHAGNIKLAEGAPIAAAATTYSTLTGTDKANNDADAYTFIGTYDFDKNSRIGLDVTYVRTQNALNTANPAGIYQQDNYLWNFGLNGKTRVAGIGLALDFAIQTGRMKDYVIPSGVLGANSGEEIKIGGWAIKFDADYTFNPVTVKFGAGYGSGESTAQQTTNGSAYYRTRNKTFVTTLENVPHVAFVYEYFTPNAANATIGGLQNTWYLSLGASADITKELYGDIKFIYLRAVKNSADATSAASVASTNPYGFLGKSGLINGVLVDNGSKDIGFEIDANLKYKIDKNLSYFVEAGYLFAGKFFRNVVGVNTLGTDWNKVDDAYGVRHGIQLSF